ncbi:MAG: NYN domain-containing protein, partial [Bacillota bacterium]|nr:NYN domain-containing protein [Bacillota bacterium]
MQDDRRIAVLIDADNVSAKYVKSILDEVIKYGTATVKRIYGDWTKPHSAKWKDVLLQNSIIPVQQYSYTTGKNSSDAALIIDAMDILYSKVVNGFCIVSSDSDFTRLVARIRQEGFFVLGMGEQKTAEPFIKACDKFTYLEVISPESTEKSSSKQGDGNAKKQVPDIKSLENLKKE